jgi:hypothetical protein
VKIEKRRIEPWLVSIKCDCGGAMKASAAVLLTHPPKTAYLCETCGAQETSTEQFPRIEWATYEDGQATMGWGPPKTFVVSS